MRGGACVLAWQLQCGSTSVVYRHAGQQADRLANQGPLSQRLWELSFAIVHFLSLWVSPICLTLFSLSGSVCVCMCVGSSIPVTVCF